MSYLNIPPGHQQKLPPRRVMPEQVHVFDEDSILAVNAALAAKRPLLVRGEPGTGKSQLAAAVASVLKRVYVSYVVDSRTEARELLWDFDAVSRLAEAQLSGGLGEAVCEARKRLEVENFLRPGPLWWAFDWPGARTQAECSNTSEPEQTDDADPANGVVVLIDEIDKAESDVPNGLLQALGAGEFKPIGNIPMVTASEPAPLIIITSNEERLLPDAFVRRCMVHCIELYEPGDELIEWLIQRGEAHFEKADRQLLKEAAALISEDRRVALEEQHSTKPGQAEYLDLLRAVINLKPKDPQAQCDLLERIGRFALQKNRGTR